MRVDGDLIATIRRIRYSPLNTPILFSVQFAILSYIINTLGPTFKLRLEAMEVVVPYTIKNFAKFILSALLKTIITKLLLSVSVNISLPIVTVIVLLTSLSLLPINCKKFTVPLSAYPSLNLPKIRYIFIQ